MCTTIPGWCAPPPPGTASGGWTDRKNACGVWKNLALAVHDSKGG
ncbi:hypothetical protein ACFV0Y_33965 [Streptomyces sp. NPDC059569]